MIDIEDELRSLTLPTIPLPDVEHIIAQGHQRRRRRRRQTIGAGAVVLAASITLATAAFSSPDAPVVGASPAADSHVFAGLDPTVVEEVVGNPDAQANANIVPEADRPALWQGMVMNFSLCRQMFHTDTTWHQDGTTPALPAPPSLPTYPESQTTIHDLRTTYGMFADTVTASNLPALDALLTNPSGCGAWVPATPGDTNGPTISDIVANGN